MPLVLRFCADSRGEKKLPVPTLALCPLRPTQSSAATCGDDSTSLLPAKRGHTFPSTPARPKRNNPRKFQPGTFLFLGGGEPPLLYSWARRWARMEGIAQGLVPSSAFL